MNDGLVLLLGGMEPTAFQVHICDCLAFPTNGPSHAAKPRLWISAHSELEGSEEDPHACSILLPCTLWFRLSQLLPHPPPGLLDNYPDSQKWTRTELLSISYPKRTFMELLSFSLLGEVAITHLFQIYIHPLFFLSFSTINWSLTMCQALG